MEQSSHQTKYICVICHNKTEYDRNTPIPIDLRRGYIEGTVYLCTICLARRGLIFHGYAGGGFGAFVSCTGRYPHSVDEYENHIKDCTYCQRKIREYKEGTMEPNLNKKGWWSTDPT